MSSNTPFERDRQVQRLLVAADRYSNPVLRRSSNAAAQERMRRLALQAVTRGHPGWPVLPTALDGIAAGDILLGILPSGVAVRASLQAMNGLTLVVGIPGAGKSTLTLGWAEAVHRAGRWACWIDSKTAPGEMLRLSLPVLDPQEASITLTPPAGCAGDVWFAKLRWVLEHSLYIVDATLVLDHTLDRVRPLLPPSREPCLADLYHALANWSWARGSWRDEQLRGTARTTLQRLLDGGHGLFTARKMLPWATRLSHSHGVRLHGVTPDAGRVFVLMLLLAFLEHQTSRSVQDRQLHGLAFLDDARWIVRDLQRSGTSGTDPFQWIHDVAHSKGLGLVVNVQSLAELGHNLVRAATTLVLAGPLHGDDVKYLRTHLQLDSDQADYLQHQLPHHAVVWSSRLGFTYPFPVRLPGPEHLADGGTAAAVQVESKRQLLAGHSQAPWSPPQEAGSPLPAQSTVTPLKPRRCSPGADKALRAVIAFPWLYQDEVARSIGIRGRELTAIRDEMVQNGYVKAVAVARFVAWEVSEAGAAQVAAAYEPLSGRGSFPHRWLQSRAAAFLRRSCRRVETEFAVGDGAQRVDVYGELADGTTLAYEIMLGQDNLDETLDKLATLAAVSTIVVGDSKAAKSAGAAAAKRFGRGGSRPLITTIAEFVHLTRA